MGNKIPTLRDAVEPSPFVFDYKDLDVQSYIGRLAPSLGWLIIYKLYEPIPAISKEFVDPELFLGITQLSPFLEALSLINKTLMGAAGSVTLPLTHEMGFGKTHFETLLFHLYTEIPKKWKVILEKVELEDNVDKLTKHFYRPDIAEKTIVFALDLKSSPEDMDPYTALFESSARILENFKEVEGKFAELLRSLSKLEPKKAARELAAYIRKIGEKLPVLILLDELYASVFETAEGEDERRIKSLIDLLIFITSFVDEAEKFCPIALVYASAQQDMDRWEKLAKLRDHLIKTKPAVANLILAVRHFKDRSSRKEFSTKQITSEDAVEVVLRRLVRVMSPRKEISDKVGRFYMETVKEFVGADAAFAYYNQIKKTYPFAPTYHYFVEKLLTPTIGGDLPKTQHIRDLLKITASLIAKVYESKEWGKVALISLCEITHDDVNHLLEERFSMEWGRLYSACRISIKEIKDEETRLLTDKMFSIVYIKSLTTNVIKLLDAIRNPELISHEEISLRGTSLNDIVFSIVGSVPDELLPKLTDAYSLLAKLPSVIDVEHHATKYLILSFVFNPMEIIESFKKEEMSRFRTPEGKPNYMEMIEYFRNQLERGYQITAMFAEASQKPDKPKLVLINYDVLVQTNGVGKPLFINYLDKEKFTVLVVTPWSIAERIMQSKEPPDFAAEIRTALQKSKSEIPYPNMMAVVWPHMELELLERLCDKIAEVHAAKRVVEYLKVAEIEEMKKKRLELAKRTPTYQTLIDILKEREERFEDIILDVMESLQKKIEDYAKSCTTMAVHDYVGDLVGSFRNIIYFDPKRDTFISDRLGVRYELR